MNNKFIIYLEIILIFIVGPLLLYFNIIPFHYWIRAIEVGFAITIILSIIHKIKIKDLGLRTDDLKQSFTYFGFITLFCVLFLIFLKLDPKNKTENVSFWWRNSFIWYMILINDPLQEFFYRGFLMERLKKLFKSPVLIILLNTFLFTFTHIIFKDFRFLIFTFFIGLLWTIAYYRYPNVLAAGLSHSIIGGLAMILGIT